MQQDWAALTLSVSIFFASEQAKKDFHFNRCRNTPAHKDYCFYYMFS
jgi:hypothetical protein